MKRWQPICVLWRAVMVVLMASSAGAVDLPHEINAILSAPDLSKAQVGVEIVQLGARADQSKIIYGKSNTAPLAPASNMKVLTTSAALDQLGADFKFRTQLVLHGNDLILIGDGDPTFGDAELLGRVGWDVDTVFTEWTRQLKQLNLPPIRNVVVDDGIFDQNFFNSEWSNKQRLHQYEAEVAGLNLNLNCLDFYLKPTQPGQAVSCLTKPEAQFLGIRNECVTGPGSAYVTRGDELDDLVLHGKIDSANQVPMSFTIHDPPIVAGNVLQTILKKGGVPSTGTVLRDRTVRQAMARAAASGDGSYRVLAIHETPLSQVLARANKESINLYAECLCKRIGAAASGAPGSWDNGTAAVRAFLLKAGVAEDSFHLVDGCGLARSNQVTAAVIDRVLVYDYFSPQSQAFIQSLGVAGMDGTLTDRFRGSPLRGNVFAKTGTIDNVSCLSGYLHSHDNTWFAFSILMNKVMPGAGRPAQEKIVAAIDKSTGKPGN